jgi:hypothetical protein
MSGSPDVSYRQEGGGTARVLYFLGEIGSVLLVSAFSISYISLLLLDSSI